MESKPENVVMSWDTWETHIEVTHAACADTVRDVEQRALFKGGIVGCLLVCVIFLGWTMWRRRRSQESAN